ncbi:hypothetical protein [Moorena sp. SIO3A5]|uniref:hypothetical protein n=1 Tax=Moorena sp. SIO3A5 TaxID=2607822 RepID=UPI00257A17C6|nr:hypothetical protein [Moorena sp. SIO3A5]
MQRGHGGKLHDRAASRQVRKQVPHTDPCAMSDCIKTLFPSILLSSLCPIPCSRLLQKV